VTDVTEKPSVPEGLLGQATEAEQAPKLATKLVMWRDRQWMVRAKPSARFLAAFEEDKIMTAIKAVLGDKQVHELLELDPDVEGDDGLEGFLTACERAWGMASGN
jgi:hypothetical protein